MLVRDVCVLDEEGIDEGSLLFVVFSFYSTLRKRRDRLT